jgi:dTDP-4-amino-4,6-dideoxygalactose transaminase
MYGFVCDMPAIMAVTGQYKDTYTVEDASQAHGSSLLGDSRVGSYGDLAAFSLFPTKPLGAAGDAGIVVTDSEVYAGYVRSYCNVGRALDDPNTYLHVGYTHRLDAVQATVLRGKLYHLDAWRKRREELAASYLAELTEHIPTVLMTMLAPPNQKDNAWYAYPVRFADKEQRERVQEHMREQGIPCKQHYNLTVPDTPAYKYNPRVVFSSEIGQAREFTERLLCLPIHEFMTEEQVKYICQEIRKGLELAKPETEGQE